MTKQLSHGFSGALRNFAGWVGRGSVGYPLFDQYKPEGHPDSESYWDVLAREPSAMETMFAVYANTLELNDVGEPSNERYAERRAAVYLYHYLTGEAPPDDPPTTPDEEALHISPRHRG